MKGHVLLESLSALAISRYVAFVLTLPAYVFCQPSAGYAQPETPRPLHLRFITTCAEEDFFKPVRKGMADAANAMNVQCTFTGTTGVNINEQVEMVLDAIREGVDGIALNIIDSTAFDKVIEQASIRGIPVVAFNGDDHLTPNGRLSAVVQNHRKAGKLFGEKISGSISANSTVLATLHSEGISALDDRLAGIKEVLKEKNVRFKIVVTSNHPEQAARIIGKALEENPDVKAILCTGLADTEGAGMVLMQQPESSEVIAAGFDLSPRIVTFIKSGRLLFTVDQQPYMQGYYPVVQLCQYLRYGIVPSDNEIGASFVTLENVAEVEELIEKGYR